MAKRTLFQEADRKCQLYNVAQTSVWEDILYIPYDDVATKRLTVLTSESGYNQPGFISGSGTAESCPMDFLVDSAAAKTGNPRNIQVAAGALAHQVHSFGTAKSFVIMHVANTAVGAAFVKCAFGTAAGATSKATVGAGVAVVDWTSGAQDDASDTTTLGTAGTFGVALVVDRAADTLSFYEMDVGASGEFALVNSVATTNGSAIQFILDDPTAVEINPAFALDSYGTLVMATDGGISLPTNLVDNMTTMASNWYAGTLGLTI